MTSKLPYLVFVALIVIFAFNFLGLHYDWYHVFWWYDIPMHIMGGAWVALAAIYVLRHRTEWAGHMSRGVFALFVLASALSVGILWEIFEYSMDIFQFQKYNFASIPEYIRLDSGYDLVNDLLGAALIVIFL